MIAVVVAGGSGSRLWPLSTPGKPKHLMSVSGEKTLLQDALARAKLFADEVYIVTDKSHAEPVAEQLSGEIDDEHIIVEPERRGTASCITLALARLAVEHGEEALVGFIHADHHIADKEAFASTVTRAGEAAERHGSIALIGIEPDYPATGFGYIKKGEELGEGVSRVAAFEEKPDHTTAEGYLDNGQYLWNLGLFAAPVSVFVGELSLHNPELFTAYGKLKELFYDGKFYGSVYAQLATQPIETALIEKTDKVVVLPGTFDWMDIGSYKDLHEVLPKSDEHGNAIDGKVICIDTGESIVIEQTGRPVAVLGLESIAVISTEKGLLICHKEYSQRVKEVAEVFNQERAK